MTINGSRQLCSIGAPDQTGCDRVVAGRSRLAIGNLARIYDEYPGNRYQFEVIDLKQQPQPADVERIVAVPASIRYLPEPARRIIDDLSCKERVIVGPDLKEV